MNEDGYPTMMTFGSLGEKKLPGFIHKKVHTGVSSSTWQSKTGLEPGKMGSCLARTWNGLTGLPTEVQNDNHHHHHQQQQQQQQTPAILQSSDQPGPSALFGFGSGQLNQVDGPTRPWSCRLVAQGGRHVPPPKALGVGR
jgi:hypothetical protein